MTKETPNTEGLSQRELILELRQDVKGLANKDETERARVDTELRKRPTRAEVMSLFTFVAIITGAVLALTGG